LSGTSNREGESQRERKRFGEKGRISGLAWVKKPVGVKRWGGYPCAQREGDAFIIAEKETRRKGEKRLCRGLSHGRGGVLTCGQQRKKWLPLPGGVPQEE